MSGLADGRAHLLPAATFHSVVDQQDHPTSQADAVPASAPVPVLWLSGATAVGKSTVGYEIFTQVYRTGVRAAYVDVQQIGALRPAADDDVVGHRLKARNLAAIWGRASRGRCRGAWSSPGKQTPTTLSVATPSCCPRWH